MKPSVPLVLATLVAAGSAVPTSYTSTYSVSNIETRGNLANFDFSLGTKSNDGPKEHEIFEDKFGKDEQEKFTDGKKPSDNNKNGKDAWNPAHWFGGDDKKSSDEKKGSEGKSTNPSKNSDVNASSLGSSKTTTSAAKPALTGDKKSEDHWKQAGSSSPSTTSSPSITSSSGSGSGDKNKGSSWSKFFGGQSKDDAKTKTVTPRSTPAPEAKKPTPATVTFEYGGKTHTEPYADAKKAADKAWSAMTKGDKKGTQADQRSTSNINSNLFQTGTAKTSGN